MPRLSKNVPPNKDREYFPVKDRGKACQPAFVRSRPIKNVEESECRFEENLFVKKLEVAMPLWGDWNTTISLSVEQTLVSTNLSKNTK